MLNKMKNHSRDDLLMLFACSAAYLVGNATYYMLPVIMIHMVKGFALSATQAGLLLTLEMVIISISSLISAFLLRTTPTRMMFKWGVLLVVIGQVFTAITDVVALLVIARMVVGVGGGLVLAITNATISASRNPEKMFSSVFIISGIGMIILLPILTLVGEKFSHTGIFGVFAVLAMTIIPLSTYILASTKLSAKQTVVPSKYRVAPYVTLVAIFLYFCGVGSVWAFSGQIGLQVGLGSGMIGLSLSAATLVGLIGGLLAYRLGTIHGHIKPIIGGWVFHLIAIVVLTATNSSYQFVICLMIVIFVFYFISPYMLGAAAMFGEGGRWGAAGAGAHMLGLTSSTIFGGVLVDWAGYQMIGITFGLLGTSSVLMLIISTGRRNALS